MKEKYNKHTSSQNPASPDFPEMQLTDSFLSGSVSSDTECTGLMPTPPASEAEMEAYEELFPFTPAPKTAGE